MTTPDYCEVTWSPTRAAAIVHMTCDEIPVDECDEAAHQLLACGNLARRMNTPPAKRPIKTDARRAACSTCGDTGMVPDTPGHAGGGPAPCPDCTPDDVYNVTALGG